MRVNGGSLSSSNASNAVSNLHVLLHEKVDSCREKKSKTYDTFCEAFFVVSIPSENAEIIQGSEKFTAPCQHRNCSIFYSYKPEIISKFPESSEGIDLNSNVISRLNQGRSQFVFP
jgi:hypothetical protein